MILRFALLGENVKLRESVNDVIIQSSLSALVFKYQKGEEMENIKILLCCGAGMSSGFLASNARKVAKKRKLAVTVEARSQAEVNEYLSSIDILMLGPHFATELEKFQNLAKPYEVPVLVIPQDIYGQLDGARIIELAQKTLEEK